MFYNGTNVTINEKGIIWAYEKDQFKRCENSENIQWIDPTDGILILIKFLKNFIKKNILSSGCGFPRSTNSGSFGGE